MVVIQYILANMNKLDHLPVIDSGNVVHMAMVYKKEAAL